MPARLTKIRKLLIVIGMLVPVLLLIGVGFMLHRSQQAMVASNHLVAHTLEVESRLARLHSLVAEAESAQRSYLLTQNPEYLPPLAAHLDKIPVEEKDLLALTADNPVQQQRLKRLSEVISARVERLQQTIALASHGQRDEAIKMVNAGPAQQFMTEIRRLIADASADEKALLKTREEAMAQKSALHAEISYALVAFAGVTAAGVLLLLWRLQRARALVTVCAWSKTIEHRGEWLSFEDYLEKRFGFNISHGISPEEAAKFTENLAQRRKQQQENPQAAA